jgi:subtilase family serine protease
MTCSWKCTSQFFCQIEAPRTAAKGSSKANLSGSSHPDSPKYGQYWTQDEIHDLFAPAEETVQAVREWLQTSGIENSRIVHSDNKGWLAFDATVEEAENLLLTEYYEHEHRHSSNVRVGCDEYRTQFLSPSPANSSIDTMFQNISARTLTILLLVSR